MSKGHAPERLIRRLLAPRLREATLVVGRAEKVLRGFVGDLESRLPACPWSEAQAVILTRVADDLRLTRFIVVRGYFAQAHALASSIYEMTYTAAFIGTDSGRATKWLEWSDLERTPWGRRKMVQAVRGEVVGRPEAIDDDARYMAFCWGKHGNPAFQRAAGVAASPEAAVLNADPALGPQRAKLGELGLWLMMDPVLVCLAAANRSNLLSERTLGGLLHLLRIWEGFDNRMRASYRTEGRRPGGAG